MSYMVATCCLDTFGMPRILSVYGPFSTREQAEEHSMAVFQHWVDEKTDTEPPHQQYEDGEWEVVPREKTHAYELDDPDDDNINWSSPITGGIVEQ